jgi:murein L,D-transpeptidase YcbB/YkuD
MLAACQSPPPPVTREIVREPEKLNPRTSEIILSSIRYAQDNQGRLDDSLRLYETDIVTALHGEDNARRLWSDERRWLPIADSLWTFIAGSERYGLFPSDYHAPMLAQLRQSLRDSAAQADAAQWARGELLFSDAFARLCRHLKLGRLSRDSVTLRQDSLLEMPAVLALFSQVQQGASLTAGFESLEPSHAGYQALKQALPSFLDSMDRTSFTYIDWPRKDSMVFVQQLQQRLIEGDYLPLQEAVADSTTLSMGIRRAQQARGLTVDGKPGPQLVGSLNNTGPRQFARIAINMDRYKQLPEQMPDRYIWINIPAYRMELLDSGNLVFESRVIVGQPRTRTPVLTSAIYNFITMPQWTVPYSIIFGEMLPRIQKSTDYLRKENLMVVDRYDSIIHPDSIDWSKLNKKYFPYLLKQRQGDDNSLGVIKFNFRNKYDVYLHDTNARGLFKQSNRARSHGCVRLQKWDSLARFLALTDSIRHHPDSVAQWIARGEKRSVALQEKLPIYIRYMTTEVQNGRIRIYDDIYGDDKMLIDRYFRKKF